MYSPVFDENWNRQFNRLAPPVKERVVKKIKKILEGLPGRHLRLGSNFFVEEVGQYRICYTSDEKRKVRVFYFVGDHKEYENWLGL